MMDKASRKELSTLAAAYVTVASENESAIMVQVPRSSTIRMAELLSELLEEDGPSPAGPSITVSVPSLDRLMSFVTRVAGAAGLIRSVDEDLMREYGSLPPNMQKGIQELGYALQYLENGQ